MPQEELLDKKPITVTDALVRLAAESGIEKGDLVIVKRGYRSHELGENAGSSDRSEKYVGGTYKVLDVTNWGNVQLQVGSEAWDWVFYPVWCVQRVLNL